MIDYHPGSYQFTFIFSLRGSVLPRAMAYAVPSGLMAIFMKGLHLEKNFEGVLTTSAAYSGFSFVVGFLLVFRTSQSYARFWDGATKVQQMKSKWCDAFNSLVAFSRISSRPREEIEQFQQTLLRLFSLMHSLALQQIHCLHGEGFDVVDEQSLDDQSLEYLKRVPCTYRLEVVSAWVHQIIVDSIDSGLLPVPAPILSRVFQELSNGSVNMENACKIAQTPFPFPYAQMMSVLLLMHWALTPILMCMWTGHWAYSFVWTFVPVLSFWGINMIAAEIEQPFGDDVNDLPTHELQKELNATLILLVDPPIGRVPLLKPTAVMDLAKLREAHASYPEPSIWASGSGIKRLEAEAYQFIEEVEHKEEELKHCMGGIGHRISQHLHHHHNGGPDHERSSEIAPKPLPTDCPVDVVVVDRAGGVPVQIDIPIDKNDVRAIAQPEFSGVGSSAASQMTPLIERRFDERGSPGPPGDRSALSPLEQRPLTPQRGGDSRYQDNQSIRLDAGRLNAAMDEDERQRFQFLQPVDHSRLPNEEPMATMPVSRKSHGDAP